MATMNGKKGVDISYANGNIDLAKVKNAGYEFVMIRCGYGSDMESQDDSQFASNVAKAEKLGMPWGVYLFSYACSTADAQSELAHIDRLLKEQASKGYYPTMPIALDIEPSNYVSNKGGWTKSNLTNVATIVLDGLAKKGYYPMIYTGYSELDGMLSDHIRNDYDCWFAQWYTSPSGYKYSRLGMWQYGGETNYLESNNISGVGTIDKNKCYKDYPTIIKNGGYNGFKKSSSTNTSSNTTTNTNQSTNTNTSKYSADNVVSIALGEVGYKEKASNSQLDSKTANVGSNNWNKYADYIDKNCPDFYNGKKNGYDWCDIFNDCIHIIAAGDAEVARKALYQPKKSTGAGCPYSAQFYRDNNAFTDRGKGMPKIGDQIFFGQSGDEYHTGIVVGVDSNYVYTVEGNSSEMVAKRQYSLSDTRISGYGHPNYTNKNTATTNAATNTTTSSSTGNSAVKEVQNWLNFNYNTGLVVDGIYGVKTKAGLVKALQTELNRQCNAGLDVDGIYGNLTNGAVINISKGAKGNITKTLQGLLICNGYGTNGFDGIFGNGTDSAVREYQSDNGLYVDGIAGKNTFSKLCR